MSGRAAAISIGGVRLGETPRAVLCATDARAGRLPPRCAPDLIEARIDLFREQTPQHVERVLRNLRSAGHPLIATIRTASEGGRWRGSERRRERLFAAVLPLVGAVDVELRTPATARRVIAAAHRRGRLAIVSSHDLRRTPGTCSLGRRIRAAHDLGADIVKIAANARSSGDVARLLRVLLAHPHMPLVVLAMGRAGTLSRVFFGAAGSLLTYAHLGGDRPAAPGQLPLHELQAELRRYYPSYTLPRSHRAT